MKRRKAAQMEVNWGDAEPFSLILQTTTDGDRIAAEKAQQTKDRQEADKHQPNLLS